MSTMYMSSMNYSADASCFAAASQSVCAHILDTAIVAVSFLSLAVRIRLLRLARIILPNRQS